MKTELKRTLLLIEYFMMGYIVVLDSGPYEGERIHYSICEERLNRCKRFEADQHFEDQSMSQYIELASHISSNNWLLIAARVVFRRHPNLNADMAPDLAEDVIEFLHFMSSTSPARRRVAQNPDAAQALIRKRLIRTLGHQEDTFWLTYSGEKALKSLVRVLKDIEHVSADLYREVE